MMKRNGRIKTSMNFHGNNIVFSPLVMLAILNSLILTASEL